jgi:hypothetical protein
MSTSRLDQIGLSGLLTLLILLFCAPVFAQDEVTSDGVETPEEGVADDDTEEDDPVAERSESGLIITSDLGVRGLPIGLSVFTDIGYRLALFESTSDVLKNTYIDFGATTGLSPAYIWAGGYIEALPVQVLQLRLTAQYLDYWGTFGVPFEFADPQSVEWGIDDLEQADSDGLAEATTGVLLQAQVTPRLKVGNLVITAETSFTHLDMDFDGVYYEPFFDMVLEPRDSFLITRPTIGWVFTMDTLDSWILAGFRWEHAHVYERDYNRELAALLALWKVPPSWVSWGEPKVALVGGWWVDHPARSNEPWIGGQFSFEWGATGSLADE